MSRTFLGLCFVIMGLLMAALNKPLAQTAIELPALLNVWNVPGWLVRVILVVGGLALALVGLLVLLQLVG